MRSIVDWWQWRREIKSSPVFRACWKAIRGADIYKRITRGKWSILTVEKLSKEACLQEYFGGADKSAPQYHQLLKDLNDASEVCIFTTETTDATGLSKRDIPALMGRVYTVILDAQHATILHVEEGVQVA